MFRIIRRTIHLTRPLPAQTALDFNDIPTPRGLPFIGTTLSLIAAGAAPKLHEYITRRHQELGPIYRDNVGTVKAVFVSDPKVMRDVFILEGKYPDHVIPEPWLIYNEKYGCTRGLTFMIGEEWMHFRKILNRMLLKGEQKWIDDACRVVCTNMIVRLKELNQDNVVIPNLERELYKWAIHALMANLIGEKQYTESYSLVKPKIDALSETVHWIFYTTSKLQLISATLASRYNIPRWKSFVKSVDDALLLARNLVEYLLKNPKSDGLLQKLVDEGVSDDDIVRIVTDLVIAAGDTTAYSMEWVIYCLAKHPEVQKQYLEYPEQQQQFRRHILKETLRLYPVAPFVTRYMPNDVVIGGYSIPKKTLMVVSLYPACRNDEYFENAATFLPNRWLREDSDHHKRFIMQQATIPFAVGTRSCIGKKLAETQLQMLTGMLIDNFEIELRNLDEIDLVLKMVAVPSKPLELILRERKTY